MTDCDGCELSDRWLEAQTMKDMVCDLWQRIEAEKVPAR
jgi:hypothetical protein